MKTIKISLILFLFALFVSKISHSATVPIYSLTTDNKGLFGYSYTHWVKPIINGEEQWIGECHSPGWTRCRRPRLSNTGAPPPGFLDLNDEAAIDELERFASIEIANGNHSGSHQVLVHVQGETQTRAYTVIWTATPVLEKPDEHTGDGQTIQINIERDFVTI